MMLVGCGCPLPCYELGKYTEAEKLEIKVLDARNRILGVEHPDTIQAMGNLAGTYHKLEE